MSAQSPAFDRSLGGTRDLLGQPSKRGRISMKFEDRVVRVMRKLGFKIIPGFELELAPGVSREISALCISREYEEITGQPAACAPDGDDENNAVSPSAQRLEPCRRLVWVEMQNWRSREEAGVSLVLNLHGMFTYLIMSLQFRYLPSAIWIVSSGSFSPDTRRFVEAVNEHLGREFFVLVDRRRLELLGGGGSVG